mmetsp:Transcript_27674/g.27897  ORF Transcript_27674/g.27897 Transcript_27674/m.27897 type:complete len:225 (+) Transcript_27674:96-770(+)
MRIGVHIPIILLLATVVAVNACLSKPKSFSITALVLASNADNIHPDITGFQNTDGENIYSHQHRNYPPNHAASNVPSPLLRQALTSSIGFLFLLLTWRTISVYEIADQFASPILRLVSVAPTVLLFCTNMIGFIVNLARPLNFKNQLKAILAMNIVREIVEMIYNSIMLLASSNSSPIPREVYFGRLFTNAWFMFLCISFSKSRWVLQMTAPVGNYDQDNYPPS